LRDLSKGKGFEQNIEAYTNDEFKEMADNFEKNYKYRTKASGSNIYRTHEYEYWSLIEDPNYDRNRVEVEYAADLPTKKYGSAFPTYYKARATDDLDPTDYETHPFNLANINRS